jgi:predicted DNA-binding ribbon-helix-helix protein
MSGAFQSKTAYPHSMKRSSMVAPFNGDFDEADVQKPAPISSLISRNVTVLGHRTSVRLEPEMWSAIKDISRRERCTVHELCSLIQLRKLDITSLTAAIRVFIMLYYRAASTEEGHTRAGHGCFNTMKRRAKILEEVEGVKAKMPNADIGMSDNDQDEFYDEAV